MTTKKKATAKAKKKVAAKSRKELDVTNTPMRSSAFEGGRQLLRELERVN